MITANLLLVFVPTILISLYIFLKKKYKTNTLTLLYFFINCFIGLLGLAIVDEIWAKFSGVYSDWFDTLGLVCALILPAIYLLSCIFFLFKKEHRRLRFLLGFPLAVLAIVQLLFYSYFAISMLISLQEDFLKVYAAIILYCVMPSTLLYLFMIDKKWPNTYLKIKTAVLDKINRWKLIPFILCLYLLIVIGQGTIRQRELLFSKLYYEEIAPFIVNKDKQVKDIEGTFGLKFNQIESEQETQYWYACAQPQLWPSCRGIRLYVDTKTGTVMRVQARGPLVGTVYYHGYDYHRWLFDALRLKFKGLDS
jgi:hypothetical protein